MLEDKIYHSSCDVIIGDWEYFGKFLKKNKIEGCENNLNWYAETGHFHNDDGSIMGYYIRIPEIDFTSKNYAVIVHELSHLTFHILDDVGIKFGADNQEPYTYLLEMLLVDFLKKAMKSYK